MKKLITLLLAVLIVFGMTACGNGGGGNEGGGAEAETIRIGVVSTFSGNNSGHGEYCKEGAELWKEEVNANGGINGKLVELVYEDNGDTNESYQSAFVKMLSEDNVVAVYSNGFSDQVTMVIPDADTYQIPFLAGNSSQACLNQGSDYYWMIRLSDAIVSPTMANACVDLLNMSKVAILQVNDSYGDGMADFVEEALKARGAEVALRLSFDGDVVQFNSYLAQVEAAGVDGIVGIAHQEQCGPLMMQIDAAEIDVPLMGCSQFATALAIDTAGESADGWYSLADWSNEADTETAQAFVKAYTEKWGRVPDMQSVVCYDAMHILQAAIESIDGEITPAAINEAIYKTNNIVGAMSTYKCDSSNPAYEHCLGQSIFTTQTVNGSGVVIGVAQR